MQFENQFRSALKGDFVLSPVNRLRKISHRAEAPWGEWRKLNTLLSTSEIRALGPRDTYACRYPTRLRRALPWWPE